MVNTAVAATGLTAAYVLYQDSQTAQAMTAAEHGLHPPEFEWPHKGMFDTFDRSNCIS